MSVNAEQKALAVINDFAPKIIEAHAAVQGNAKTMMEFAILAGELLTKAKKKVPHGQWAAWVEKNCKFSARTASDYMRMAEHKKQIGRDLPISICGALAKLAKPKPEKKPEQEQESGGTDDDHVVTGRAPQSDDTDDLASDEKVIRWAEQMFLRCRADCKDEDLDLKRCFTELVKLLANEIGTPES
jgi:hypothetical protein